MPQSKSLRSLRISSPPCCCVICCERYLKIWMWTCVALLPQERPGVQVFLLTWVDIRLHSFITKIWFQFKPVSLVLCFHDNFKGLRSEEVHFVTQQPTHSKFHLWAWSRPDGLWCSVHRRSRCLWLEHIWIQPAQYDCVGSVWNVQSLWEPFFRRRR